MQSREEIEAYSIDENISDLERAKLYCSQGTVIQKTCLVNNIPALYRVYKNEIENDVLLKLTVRVCCCYCCDHRRCGGGSLQASSGLMQR